MKTVHRVVTEDSTIDKKWTYHDYNENTQLNISGLIKPVQNITLGENFSFTTKKGVAVTEPVVKMVRFEYADNESPQVIA